MYQAIFGFLPIYQYRPKQSILSASVGVDKMLLYSSHIQTTCARSTMKEVKTIILQQR